MMTYQERITDIYTQLQQGKLLEAFDHYYAEEVVMTEPRGTRNGKAANRAYEEQFLDSVEAFNGLEIKNVGSNEANETSFIEVAMDVTFKGGQRVVMEQVAVQQWKGDHIVHERFYYDNAQ